MKHLIVLSFITLSLLAVATDKPAAHRLTPEQKREYNEHMNMKRFGGIIRKANTAHGSVIILNAQTAVGKADVQRALNVIEDKIHPILSYRDISLDAGANLTKVLKENKAELGVFIVNVANQPMLLVAPESGWAMVNVAALNDGCDKATLAHRVRVQMLRAFAYVGGGCNTMRDPIVMRTDIITAKDLDMITEEDYGVDVVCALESNLPLRGVTPWRITTYKKACQEGWAHQPTNEFQKAIWDKVHQIPSEPIKIKYEKPAAK